MYVDAAYCYRLSSVVCRSVSLSVSRYVTIVRFAKTAEPIDTVWIEDSRGYREPRIRWGSYTPREWAILREEWWPIVKYRDTLRSYVQKRLNRSKCRLGRWLGLAKGIMTYMGPDPP